MEKLRTIVSEDESGTQGSWEPWAVASVREGGEELLKEMVTAGTVIARRNPKLPPSSQIPYPLNMEVKVVKEVFSKKQKTSTIDKANEAGDTTDMSEFNTKFQCGPETQQMPLSGGQQGGGSSVDPPESKPKVDEVSKVAMRGITKALWKTITRNNKNK